MTIEDYNCADFLRKFKREVILIVNKVELKQAKNYKDVGYELGFGNPYGITAKNKSAKIIINKVITNALKSKNKKNNLNIDKGTVKENNKINISISGKPNTGKSTIFNIYGSNRVIVSAEAGTTRDSVREEVLFKNYLFDLVDTAGIKKNQRLLKVKLIII